ncbi:MAG: chorismate mutase [Anaerovoracaceae bacterium]
MDLNDLRKEIDNIDVEMVKLFQKRMEISKEIGEYKSQKGLPILDKKREEEKIECITNLASNISFKKYLKELYNKIFQLSRDYQSEISDTFGLIGEKLGHSFSKEIHQGLGLYTYSLFELKEEEIKDFLLKDRSKGYNVTVPYKKTIMEYCNFISEEAREIGAVNTIVKGKDGSISGYNTDYYGFIQGLAYAKINPKDKKCLVLGSGGSSATVCYALKKLKAKEIIVVSRTGENNYHNLSNHFDSEIIINTTPVGMYPNNLESLIDLDNFEKCSGVFDLIYNPIKTKLILDATKKNIPNSNGLYMLVAQAMRAAKLFCEEPIDEGRIKEAYSKIYEKKINTILIGMPGSGKSTVGRRMAERTNRPFVDIDDEIVLRTGKSISEIFEDEGEESFRAIESEVLKDICKKHGFIIATGGGVVTVESNYDILKQNGELLYIKRDLSFLDTRNRPLSLNKSVENIYLERKDSYEKWSDKAFYNQEER